MQNIVCHVVQRDSLDIKFDRVEIAFISASMHWLKDEPMKEGRKLKLQEKIPKAEVWKMPHIKARKFKPQPRLESAL